MKKITIFALICTMLLTCVLPLGVSADGGSEPTPTPISTVAEFEAMAADGNYILTKDIDFEGKTYSNGYIIEEFHGTLDGGNFAIKNFTIAGGGDALSGIFKVLAAPASLEDGQVVSTVIKNLKVGTSEQSVTMTVASGAETAHGVLAGAHNNKTTSLTIENVHIYATVTGATKSANFGGFLGASQKTTFKNCSMNGSITLAATNNWINVGGFMGNAKYARGSLTDCTNNANITVSALQTGTTRAGGFAGYVEFGLDITRCTNNGNLICDTTSATPTHSRFGGIVADYCFNTNKNPNATDADKLMTISDCTNTGNVSSAHHSGAILGFNSRFANTISGCSNTGNITTADKTLSAGFLVGGSETALTVSDNTAPVGYGARVYHDGEIKFTSYTTGAEAAFDESLDTAYAGSITGKFEHRSVITGIAVEAGKPITNLKIYGSEDGGEWKPLYSQEKIRSVAVFGHDGSDEYTDDMLNAMYTYAFKYLRFEMEYGSIADITVYGYGVFVDGRVEDIKASESTMIYLAQEEGAPALSTEEQAAYDAQQRQHITEHIIGSKTNGGAVLKGDADFAYLKLELNAPTKLSAISFIHQSNDKNVTRWNNLKFEVSVDGESWETVKILPADFSYIYNLRNNRAMMFIDVESDTEYSFVRLSVASGGMSIGAVDVYADISAPTLDEAALLNSWEGDPYIALSAEADEPEEDTNADPDSEAAPEEEATDEELEDEEAKKGKGCKSALGSYAAVFALVSALTLCICTKKRKAE